MNRAILTSFGRPQRCQFWTYLFLGLHFILVAGCGRGLDEAEVSDINSPLPSYKAAAMHKVAQSGSYEYIEEQIQLLADEDFAVRFYAIMSLKRLTGTDNGYNYRHDASRRNEAIKRWHKWLEDYKAESVPEAE